MKKMKLKKLLSFLLCCVMVFGLMPLTAFAEGEETPITAVELTLENYAVGKKAGEISVEITTENVVFTDGPTYCQFDEEGRWKSGSYFIIYYDEYSEYILGPEDTLEAGKPYEIIIDIEPEAGFTLEDLTHENATLNGTKAWQIGFNEHTGLVTLDFKLEPLEISITDVELTLGNYEVGKKAGDIFVGITTQNVDFLDGASYLHKVDGDVTGSYYIFYFDEPYCYELGPEDTLEAGKPYVITIYIKPQEGFTLKDLTEANTKLNGIEAYEVNYDDYEGIAELYFKLEPLEIPETDSSGGDNSGIVPVRDTATIVIGGEKEESKPVEENPNTGAPVAASLSTISVLTLAAAAAVLKMKKR
ncbi:MAG: hypothetical protein ACI4IW_03380 [Oscillospiraceae bacterium]